MQLRDFSYDIPTDRIAQSPLVDRSASRLLALDGRSGAWRDHTMRELPLLMRRGDLLIFNDTRVVAARLLGTKPSGGRVEMLLERAIARRDALIQLKDGKAVRPGMAITTSGGDVELLERRGELWHARFVCDPMEFFEKWGTVPLPPYIKRKAEFSDRERYQSIFAREKGAVAAPTASLHFDRQLVDELAKAGVEIGFVTLHVGAGTFQPVRTPNLDEVALHAERIEVGAPICEAIRRTHDAGGRVVAVGTTVVRALESAALAAPSAAIAPMPFNGETRLFIRPGFEFRVVDALITNFHVSESTLLMLVCAFAGREHTLAAYAHAIEARYRFFSYGDAMYIEPQTGRR
jgi:S-adenosylmethionine:tRNA ribosyltransferase-isomerase